MIRVFLDANVIFAASYSSKGAARVLVRLSKQVEGITLLATPYTIDKAERNIQRELPSAHPEFLVVREHLSTTLEPSEDLVVGLNSHLPSGIQLPSKDLPVLGGAIVAGADWLLTHDEEHFGPLYGKTVQGVEIMKPGTALRRLRRPAERGV